MTYLLAGAESQFAQDLLRALRRLGPSSEFRFIAANDLVLAYREKPAACIYAPSFADCEGMTPDLGEAENVFRQGTGLELTKFILLSSALIYGAGPGRQSMVSETYRASDRTRRIAKQWQFLEMLARQCLQDRLLLTILRPVTVLPSASILSRRLLGQLRWTIAGYDPMVQLLDLSELARAVLCALESSKDGEFNLAPDGAAPLRAAIRASGGRRLALPRSLQRLRASSEALEYLRYSWTVSNNKIKQQMGFSPQRSSTAVLMDLRRPEPSGVVPQPPPDGYDEFGLDGDYIDTCWRRCFKFLGHLYWRIEARGLEHIPREGGAILVGIHRGFIPLDGIMVLHLIRQHTGRVPRFLTHPGLLKLPFIANFVAKFGGVVACQESADRVLGAGGMLGVFPEGVNGAFALYRQAYQLKDFGRHSFAKLALRHRVPIIPFVTIGSAEIFPVFARIKSRLWTRYLDWPWLPLSTFPLLPFPLPSKWHIQFLPPIHMEQFPSEPAQESALAKSISVEVQAKMQNAVDGMLCRRRSIFFGSIFKPQQRVR